MKYRVAAWGGVPGAARCVTVLPDMLKSVRMNEADQVAIFPYNGDHAKEEQARMLATKVCAFLNELEEKKAQLLELMTIAGANEK